MGACPDNPMGSHSHYFDWSAYLIHGTHDTRKIGRKCSDGCIGLFNENVAALYVQVPIKSQIQSV
jgi:lipoprotein-anchoring transpeptidase ErfK/SrfK